MRSIPIDAIPSGGAPYRILVAALRGAAGDAHLRISTDEDVPGAVEQIVVWMVSAVTLAVSPQWRDVFAEASYVVKRLSSGQQVHRGLLLDVHQWLRELSTSTETGTRYAAMAVEHAIDVLSPDSDNEFLHAETCAYWSARATAPDDKFLHQLADMCRTVVAGEPIAHFTAPSTSLVS